ncbi:MAG: hypothetical protein K2K11_04900, partial [Bacteroidales bacterium]|nr:hypothetical protein [Bacteroidales bacterium]
TWQTDSIFGNLAEGRYYVAVKADGGCDPEKMLPVYVQNQPDYEFDTLSFRVDTIYACNGKIDLFPYQTADSATGLGYIGWFEDSAMTKFLKRSPEYVKSHSYLPERRFLDTVGVYEFWAVESAGLCVGKPNKFVYVVSSCDAELTPKRDTICPDDTVLFSLVIDTISLRNAGGWFFQYSVDSKFTPASTQNITSADTLVKEFRDNRAGSYRVAYITPNRDTLYHEPSTLWVGSYADPSKYITLAYPKTKATDMCPEETATFTFRDKSDMYEVLWPGDTIGTASYSRYYAEKLLKTDTIPVRIRSVLGGCEVNTGVEVIVREAPTIDLLYHDTTLCYEDNMYLYFPQILDTGKAFYIKYEWTTLDGTSVGSGPFLVQNSRFLVEPDTTIYLARAATGYAECPSLPDTFRVVAHPSTWDIKPSQMEVCAGNTFTFRAGTPFDSIRFGEGLWQPRGNDSFTLGPIYKDSTLTVTILRKICESTGTLKLKSVERDTLAVKLTENADACVALTPATGTSIDLGLHARLQYRVQGTENSAFAGLVY